MVQILPKIEMKRLAVKLKPAAERMVKKKHPWVFENSIKKISREPKTGDLAIIYDNKKNKFLACGFYDAFSPIKIKLIQFQQAKNIDKKWIHATILTAYEKRKPLFKTKTNSYRLIFGENDNMPSFIADIYNNVLVVKLYSTIWFPIFNEIIEKLKQITNAETGVLRLSRNVEKIANSPFKDGQVIFGELQNENVVFKEYGVNFSANVIHGHKTGYFLDHRFNRNKVGKLAKGKSVLDVFTYTGGFSVHALANSATEVTSVDISKQALEQLKQNAALNEYNGKLKTIAGDAFEVLNMLVQKKQRFDIIVIDPPSFAKSEKEINKAKTSYARLAKLGAKLVSKKGILVLASCSSRITADDFFEINEQALQQSSLNFKLVEKTFHDIDHPIGFPEGAYLKCGYYKN